MTTCGDNPQTKRVGCGATFTGRQQHAVARVAWSTHEDGRAHLTFANEGASEKCWKSPRRGDADDAYMRHPSEVGLVQDDKGVWRRPGNRPLSLRAAPSVDEPGAGAATTPEEAK